MVSPVLHQFEGFSDWVFVMFEGFCRLHFVILFFSYLSALHVCMLLFDGI